MTGQASAAPTTQIVVRPTPDQVVDVATLRSQISDLRVQLTGLQAQWDGLHSQLNAMLKNNPARPGVQQKWADVGVQIAQVKGDIAFREARISQLRGVPDAGTSDPAGPFSRPIDPNVAFPAATVLLMVLGLPVSIAWARRIFRGRPQAPAPRPEDTMRLEQIERAIDTVAIEVERISEGQRFVTRILAGRPENLAAAASDVGARSAAAAPLALGPGSMEPILVPERERVRQPLITPH